LRYCIHQLNLYCLVQVILYLYRSLKHSVFRQILLENRIAADHYLRYLETKNEVNHLVDLLKYGTNCYPLSYINIYIYIRISTPQLTCLLHSMLGRTREGMIIRYKQILKREGNLQMFLKEMEHFHKAECQLSEDDVASLISQHLQLLRTSTS
jgi:hypothetical protein